MAQSIIDRLVRSDGAKLPIINTSQIDKDPTTSQVTIPTPQDMYLLFANSDGGPRLITHADLIATLVGPPGPPGSGGGGYVFVTGVTALDSGGLVGSITYDPASFGSYNIWTECTTDSANVRVSFLAEGGAGFAPSIDIDGVFCTNLAQVPNEIRLFQGSIDIAVPIGITFTLTSTAGNSSTIRINKVGAGPVLSNMSVSAIPTGQSQVKSGDTITVSGEYPVDAVEARIVGIGACIQSAWQPLEGATFSIHGTVSTRSGFQNVVVEARNAFGTIGVQGVLINALGLDQTVPAFSGFSYSNTTVPSNSAFKATELGSVSLTISNNPTGATYASPRIPACFNIQNPTLLEPTKVIQCLNPGTYVDSGSTGVYNFHVEAVKSTNGTSNSFDAFIDVADVAPVLTVSHPGTALRSTALGTNYTITASSNQNLASAPGINTTVPNGGTWLSAFSGSNKTWSSTLKVTDAHTKASGASWVFTSVPTNKAGIPAQETILGTHSNAGFVSRDLTLSAYLNTTTLGVNVTNYNNVSLSWLFSDGSVAKDLPYKRDVGTVLVPDQGAWCIDSLTTPNNVVILDTPAAYSKDEDTIIRIQETV